MKAWYCVYTNASMEKWARSNLWERGFEVLLPLYLKKRRHARKVDMVERPLFPRYLFVEADLEAGEKPRIASAPGVDSLVALGRRPTRVPEAVIAELRGRTDERGLIALAPEAPLQPGEAVVVEHGALARQIGLFERMSDNDRVVVLLDFLGRQVRTTVPAERIERARN